MEIGFQLLICSTGLSIMIQISGFISCEQMSHSCQKLCMMLLIQVFLVLLPLLLRTNAINTNFIVDFIKLKQSKSVVFFLCDVLESYRIYRSLEDDNITMRFINIGESKGLMAPEVLPQDHHARTACVFDYSCSGSLEMLQKVCGIQRTKIFFSNSLMHQFSDHRYFNSTYSWLFFNHNDSSVDVNAIFWQLTSIQMNSDVTNVKEVAESNETLYELEDVYAKGRHLCKDIFQNNYGKWDTNAGLVTDPGYNRYYTRRNFYGIVLRGTTVIDRDNVTTNDVDRSLSEPGSGPGIVVFVKYHYALLSFLSNYHNFSIKYRVTRGWAGRLKNGYRLGMLGILSRNEADDAASGIFQRINRHAEFDIIHQSWEFKSGFIYRITPQLARTSSGGNFLTPFDTKVWMASTVTAVFIVIVLKLVGLIIFKTHQNELNLSLAAYIVDVVGTISQQGIPSQISPRLSIKIALSALLMMNLVLYNYYTSAVVGGLLSSPGRGPETVREIIDSALVLSFRDIGYHKILFRESTVPIIRELYEKKVKPSREGKEILPVYADVITAVPHLKQGGYAFHCEMTEAFQDIANKFDANEVCELRTTKGLFNDLRLMSFVLPKRSMYTEMFRITYIAFILIELNREPPPISSSLDSLRHEGFSTPTGHKIGNKLLRIKVHLLDEFQTTWPTQNPMTNMMRVQEVGLIKRTLKIHKIEKPICQSGGRVHPVEFFGVSTAFGVLCVGTILAAILLIAERLSSRSPRKVMKGSPVFLHKTR